MGFDTTVYHNTSNEGSIPFTRSIIYQWVI